MKFSHKKYYGKYHYITILNASYYRQVYSINPLHIWTNY